MLLKNVRRQPHHDHQRTKQVLIKNISSLRVHQSHSDLSQLTQSSNVSLYVSMVFVICVNTLFCLAVDYMIIPIFVLHAIRVEYFIISVRFNSFKNNF